MTARKENQQQVVTSQHTKTDACCCAHRPPRTIKGVMATSIWKERRRRIRLASRGEGDTFVPSTVVAVLPTDFRVHDRAMLRNSLE